MTLINLKKFNTMVKKHHSIDLNMQKINSNPINKNFEKNNLSNLNNLFSSSHNGGFFNQSQNFNKDMSIKVKLSNSNKKLQDVMRSSQNFLENRNLNVSPLRNFQTSFIHNMSTGFNLNSNGLLTSIKCNEENKPKNEISQKLDKISSTLNLKSISNFKEV